MTITATEEKLYSFEEYCNYNDDPDNYYELVDGKLELMSPPTYRHLIIAKFIENQLEAEISRLKLPLICLREAGVRTGWRKSRLADIYVIETSKIKEFLDKNAIAETPPLLVVEVVSQESINRDYRYKRSEYAANNIPEYWIIDPLKNQVTVLILEEGFYEETVFNNDEKIVSQQFSDLNLTVNQIFAASNL
jgi:Uma2 family endonuclease